MMTFADYLICSDEEFYAADVRDIRRAIERDVNCFGYEPRDTFKNCGDWARYGARIVTICAFQTQYEANEQTWVDDRNRQSNEVLKKIAEQDTFQKGFCRKKRFLSEQQIKFHENLAKEIGTNMHRTNLQTFSSMVCLIDAQSDEIREFLRELRGSYDRYYKFCMI